MGRCVKVPSTYNLAGGNMDVRPTVGVCFQPSMDFSMSICELVA